MVCSQNSNPCEEGWCFHNSVSPASFKVPIGTRVLASKAIYKLDEARTSRDRRQFCYTLGFLLSTSIEVAEEVRLHTRITNKLGTFGSAELAQTAWRL